jgi:hypothetical protein
MTIGKLIFYRPLGIALSFLQSVLEKAEEEGLLSKEHFFIDGTLLEA